MNQKTIIAILGVVVVILLGTNLYFATINKSTQTVSTTPKITQQPKTRSNKVVPTDQEKNTDTILEKNEYSGDLVAGKNQNYKMYKNDEIGISFIYVGNEKSYINEEDDKLQFVDYYEKTGKYIPSGQDYIEVYQKNTDDSFETAVNKIISQKASSLNQCLINITKSKNKQILNITYKEEYVYDKNKCLPDDEGPECSYRQIDEHTKLAFTKCSNFENGPYGNYFIYQPQNTKNKIVFVRHVVGMDAAPWDASTIELFESK